MNGLISLNIHVMFLAFLSTMACNNKMTNNNKDVSIEIPESTITIPSIDTFDINDTIKVVLDGNFNGGYEWLMIDNDSIDIIGQFDSTFKEKEKDLLYKHSRTYFLQAVISGEITMNFYRKRNFEPDSLAIYNAYIYKVLIK